MSDANAKFERREPDHIDSTSAAPAAAKIARPRTAAIPLVITLAATALAIVMGSLMWDAYMAAPWTRDATVRTYVVTMAPEVAGRIVQLPVKDNQLVHKGDLLLVIDPTDYKNALQLAEANVEQARANALNAQLELQRRSRTDRSMRQTPPRARLNTRPPRSIEIRPRSISNVQSSALP
jgi:multidrug resistance efflux pump